jgi:serine/threonine-protein kinase
VIPIQKLDSAMPSCVAGVVNKAMQLTVENRYQSPGAMVADLRVAERKLRDGDDGDNSTGNASTSNAATVPDTGHSVMIVESDVNVQNLFREGFKRAGYRVLVIADPVRAVSRFRQDPVVADCAIFNAQFLGQAAVEMFNELGDNERTQAVPAILLLDETQKQWKSQAQVARHRIALTMPITMKQLRNLLAQLTSLKDVASSNA